MRVSPLRRSHLGIAAILSLVVTATLISAGTTAVPVAAQSAIEPQFLAWDGDPFADDLNHYLVRIDSAVGQKGDSWLRLDAEDHLVAADPQNRVSVQDIEEAVAEPTHPDRGQVVEAVVDHPAVTSMKAIGFDIYAVAGAASAAELSAIPGVTEVVADTGVISTSVDPYYPTQWALENDGDAVDPWPMNADADIDAPESWHRTRGAGVVVAVIDSGTDITHPDLADNIWRNPREVCGNGTDDDANGYIDDCVGWDFANGDASVDDHVGHGTHIAGIIAAEADNGIGVAGVAYEANVMVLKIGDGTPALSAAIEAIAYAVYNGARVINASWAVDDPAAAPYLETALTAAADAGVLVVTGAGNEPVDIDASPIYPASSSLSNVIVVGASTPTDDPASWSGYGQQTVDLFAPGEYIISTVPGGYGVYSGTSMAAPMVSGAAALLWAATPGATYAEVKGALLDRSDGPNDGVTSFRNLASSDGRLNIERSIYTRLFQPSLMYDFYEFNSFEPHVPHKVAITAKTVDPWIIHPQTPAMYRAGLYVPVDGNPMAVVGQEITYTGEGGDLAVTTDATGRALIGTEFERQRRSAFVQDGDFTPLAMELPAGTYAFVIEVVDVTDPTAPVTLGDPSAVFFIVDDAGNVTEMPQIPVGGDPVPTSSTTTAPHETTTTITSTTTSQATTTTIPEAVSTTITAAPNTTTTTAVTVTSTTTQPPVPTTTTAGPAPTTSAPPTIAPPTTVASTTTTTTTVTAPPATTTTTTGAPVDPNAIVITGINPAQGPVAGNTLVTITGGNLPELPEVTFGERGVEIVSVIAPTFIVVDTPPGSAGFVDVTVTDRTTGAATVYRDGFQYVADGEVPATTTTTTTSPSLTTTTVMSPSTTITTTTSAAPTTSTTLVTSTTMPVPDGTLDDWLEDVLRTPEGLDLAPPAVDDPINAFPVELWAGALCDEPVCPGWVLED
ncbi:MAG: S8 family serine peptidase [bacterium]|nr:S8 family serine peptidase [bacterium]